MVNETYNIPQDAEWWTFKLIDMADALLLI